MNAKTYSVRESEIERRWYVVDATDETLGRLASRIARSERPKSSSPSPSSEVSSYSSMSRFTRFSISSLALTWAQMSPTVWSGVRTLARRSATRVSSTRPSRMRCVSGRILCWRCRG